MTLQIMGEHPLEKDENGKLKNYISTLLPFENAIITGKGIHATLAQQYVDKENIKRIAKGLKPFTLEEEINITTNRVSLILQNDKIYIRPDVVDLSLNADEILKDIVPDWKIRYLEISNPENWEIKHHLEEKGQCWKMNINPNLFDKVCINNSEIYYYNKNTGTRYLTYDDFSKLDNGKTSEELANTLNEIKWFVNVKNRLGNPEVALFKAQNSIFDNYKETDFTKIGKDHIYSAYNELKSKFHSEVKEDLFRKDDKDSKQWREAMLANLKSTYDSNVCEEELIGLDKEFHIHIRWLAGAEIVNGSPVQDPAFKDFSENPNEPQLQIICDKKVPTFIDHFIEEYPDLEYINIGEVTESLSGRINIPGRRKMYLASMKTPSQEHEIVKIIRMMKWDVMNRITTHGDSFEKAKQMSTEYANYILDRHKACRKLGMKIPHTKIKHVTEQYEGQEIPSTYIERDYVRGMATNKIPTFYFNDREFSLSFGKMLWGEAAINMIAGRFDPENKTVLFDDADEILKKANGTAEEIVVADPTKAFADYMSDFYTLDLHKLNSEKFKHGESFDITKAYAEKLSSRIQLIEGKCKQEDRGYSAQEFVDVCISSFIHKFEKTKQYCKTHKAELLAIDFLDNRPATEEGSMQWKWRKIIDRLESADAKKIGNAIKSQVQYSP
jgi:hypothetical protein